MLRYLFAALAAVALAGSAARAHDHHAGPAPAAAPGCNVVPEVCYQEVVRYVCKVVPDVKKTARWVYDCKDDPFCIHKSGKAGCGHHGCADGTCPSCDGPYCRKQLIKREVIDECPTTKCVVERVVDRVPYTVYRQVPWGLAVVPGPDPLPTAGAPAVQTLRNPPALVSPPR